jgi:4-hydroxy-tetrahydrodipicolinate reductase
VYGSGLAKIRICVPLRQGGDGPLNGVRIGLVGVGSIGSHVARLLLDHRTGVEIVAAATKDESAVGKPLHEVAKARMTSTVQIVDSIEKVLECRPKVVIHATTSFLRDVAVEVTACAEAGAHVISCSEELAFPFLRHGDHAEMISRVAASRGVTVLGTGVNPGVIFDQLLLSVSGVCWTMDRIRGRRVVDVSGFGRPIHRRLGIGYSLEEFRAGHDRHTIAGHVGFPESIDLVCARLGIRLDGPVEESFEPLPARTSAPTRYGEVPAGCTEGFIQTAIARTNRSERLRLELVLHLRPAAAGYEPADSLTIDGIHPVQLKIQPGMDAILATSAQLVNSIPVVLSATPGLKSVKDLPVGAAWLGPLASIR